MRAETSEETIPLLLLLLLFVGICFGALQQRHQSLNVRWRAGFIALKKVNWKRDDQATTHKIYFLLTASIRHHYNEVKGRPGIGSKQNWDGICWRKQWNNAVMVHCFGKRGLRCALCRKIRFFVSLSRSNYLGLFNQIFESFWLVQ